MGQVRPDKFRRRYYSERRKAPKHRAHITQLLREYGCETLEGYLDEDQLKNTDWCIRHCSPWLGTDFIVTAKALLTDPIRNDLQNLRTFHFAPHPDIFISPARLDRFDQIVQRQLDRILR